MEGSFDIIVKIAEFIVLTRIIYGLITVDIDWSDLIHHIDVS